MAFDKTKFAAFDAILSARLRAKEKSAGEQKTLTARIDETKRLLRARDLRLRKNIDARNALLEVGSLTGNIEHDEALIARLRDDDNWLPTALVVVGQYQLCNCCGARASATSGFFMREKHKTIPSAVRMRALRAIPDEPGVPIETAIDGVVLPRCIECTTPNIVDDLLAQCVRDTPPAFSNQLPLELH